MRQSLDNGGLSNAGLADEAGVVLGAAAEYLDDPLDLFAAPYHGVELSGARRRRQVHAQLVQCGCPRGRANAGVGLRHILVEVAHRFGTHLFQADPQALQDAGSHALALPQQAEEQVLGADVVVVEAPCLIYGKLYHPLGARGEADLPAGGFLAAPDDVFDGAAHLLQVNAEAGQHLGGHAFALSH